jgi:putative addiction module killer protein
MIEVLEAAPYSGWFKGLKDKQARARIIVRIRRLSLGNLGDVRPIGDGLSELRIHTGPGYRIYLMQRGRTVVILLGGGDKGTQKSDIAAAKALAKELREQDDG